MDALDDLIRKLLSEGQLCGMFFAAIKPGYSALGMNSGSCSLADFNVLKLSYEAEYFLLSVTLSRAFPIVRRDDWMTTNVEWQQEIAEVEFKYCLLRHCLLSASVNIVPGQFMSDGQLLSKDIQCENV
ncbi:hypothetical protein J7G16_004598 [Vibrio parahaemolyticus]|nr:hypothetical protein [Vibrio parahaemolyticus]